MDPKLKAYLDKQFKNLATKKDLQVLEKRIEKGIEAETSDVLEVIGNINSNISNNLNKIENEYSYLQQHTDHIFKRVEYLEKKLLK